MGRRGAFLLHPGFIYMKRRGQAVALPPTQTEEKKSREPAAELTQAGLADSLGEQEKRILSLLALGLSNREIATALSVSPGLVRRRLYPLFRRLGVKNRTQAAVWWFKNLPQQQQL